MALVKCPNCNTERIVLPGKPKNCRKCGNKLTATPQRPPKPAKMTADELKNTYPEQVKEIVEAVSAAAVEKYKAKFTADRAGITAVKEGFPELIDVIEKGKPGGKKQKDQSPKKTKP